MKRLVPAIFFGGIVAFLLILVLAELTSVGQSTVPLPANSETDQSIDRAEIGAALRSQEDVACDPVELEFSDMLSKAASCDTDADCVLADFDCVSAVNKTFLDSLNDLGEKRCHLSAPICAGPINEWQAVCARNQCTVVDRRTGSVTREMEQELIQEFRENLETNIGLEMSDRFRSELVDSGLATSDIELIVTELESASATCFVNSLVEHAKIHSVPVSDLITEVENEVAISPVGLDFFELLDPCLNAARMEAGIALE